MLRQGRPMPPPARPYPSLTRIATVQTMPALLTAAGWSRPPGARLRGVLQRLGTNMGRPDPPRRRRFARLCRYRAARRRERRGHVDGVRERRRTPARAPGRAIWREVGGHQRRGRRRTSLRRAAHRARRRRADLCVDGGIRDGRRGWTGAGQDRRRTRAAQVERAHASPGCTDPKMKTAAARVPRATAVR